MTGGFDDQAAGGRAVAVSDTTDVPVDLGEASSHRARGALIAVSVALFCIQVDFFALNLVIPDMGRAFHADPRDVQWTISARHHGRGSEASLVRRGLAAPLSMKANWTPPEG